MPLPEFEEKVSTELAENPALDPMTQEEEWEGKNDDSIDENTTFEEREELQEREDALESALAGIGRDDEMPPTFGGMGDNNNAEYEERVYGNVVSFYELLHEQMGEMDLTPQQQTIMEYLIGSLDSDGLLRKDLDIIGDELAVHYYIDVSRAEIEQVLHLLQTFDPPGIGAQSLKECLLLQVDRLIQHRKENTLRDDSLSTLHSLRKILAHHYEAFTRRHWDKIQTAMHLSDAELEQIRKNIHKLNPKPGASLGEAEARSLQQITPDFIVETADDGQVTCMLARGQVPELKVSSSFLDMVDTYKTNRQNMSRQDKEALLYVKEKVDRARGFIEAVKQRRRTLLSTMQAIVDWQLKFFQEGDESDLRPMILKDIATKTGLDISTVSRVSNHKYAQTRWGIFPLKFFFTESLTTENGEELSTRKVKLALAELVEKEDKHHPLSDDSLSASLKRHGYPVARRTVAKYREQLGIPVARLRKE